MRRADFLTANNHSLMEDIAFVLKNCVKNLLNNCGAASLYITIRSIGFGNHDCIA